MKNTTFIFALTLSQGVFAQTIYSDWTSATGHVSTSRSPDFLCTSLTCPTINGATNTVDNNMSNYATVNFPLVSVLASATFTMDLSQTVTSGLPGGVFLSATTSLTGLSVLPSFQVELMNNNTVVGSATHSALLNLSLMSSTGINICATPGVSTPVYNRVRLTILSPVGVSIPMQFRVYYAYGNNTTSCLASVLPVRVTNFHVTSDKACNVSLQWESKEQINISKYAIERQLGVETIWKEIATIQPAPANTPTLFYHYLDKQVDGSRVAYRVVSSDHDGSKLFHEIKTATLACGSSKTRVYPTVTSGKIYIKLPETANRVAIDIVDVSGVSHPISFSGNGLERTANLAPLKPGIYMVRVANEVFKIVKTS